MAVPLTGANPVCQCRFLPATWPISPAAATAGPHIFTGVATGHHSQPHLLASGLARSPTLTYHPSCQRPRLIPSVDSGSGVTRASIASPPVMVCPSGIILVVQHCSAPVMRFPAAFDGRAPSRGPHPPLSLRARVPTASAERPSRAGGAALEQCMELCSPSISPAFQLTSSPSCGAGYRSSLPNDPGKGPMEG